MKKMNKKGFTIVELVIVIAVIAILAAVMIPTFSGVVGKAQASANLQKARNAYAQYTADIDYKTGKKAADIVYVQLGEVDENSKADYAVIEAGEVAETTIHDTIPQASAVDSGKVVAIINVDGEVSTTITGTKTTTP